MFIFHKFQSEPKLGLQIQNENTSTSNSPNFSRRSRIWPIGAENTCAQRIGNVSVQSHTLPESEFCVHKKRKKENLGAAFHLLFHHTNPNLNLRLHFSLCFQSKKPHRRLGPVAIYMACQRVLWGSLSGAENSAGNADSGELSWVESSREIMREREREHGVACFNGQNELVEQEICRGK